MKTIAHFVQTTIIGGVYFPRRPRKEEGSSAFKPKR